MSSPRPRQSGYTAIELITVLGIAGLLVGLTAPSFRDFGANRRMTDISYDLLTDLAYARSEALKRNASVSVAPKEGGWLSGWTVTDADGNALRARGALDTGSGRISVDPGPAEVTYNSSGRLQNAGVVRIGITNALERVPPRCISIDPSGRPRSERASCP